MLVMVVDSIDVEMIVNIEEMMIVDDYDNSFTIVIYFDNKNKLTDRR
jgi:hypothetical protein